MVAIGNALGLSAGTPTVTQGIISAKGRTVAGRVTRPARDRDADQHVPDRRRDQPGELGRPAGRQLGQVIGMNTAVAVERGRYAQAQNIGFAIPSNKIYRLLPALRDESIANPAISGSAFLGVSIETLTPRATQRLQLRSHARSGRPPGPERLAGRRCRAASRAT